VIQPSNLRRLAVDHAALHGDKLPPYYLLPPDDGRFAAADDLSQLTVLLAGPTGTPYSQGLWRLHLKMPEDYPNSPPKATFRTRIWHPNVEELTGAVCVDTLKRDWQSKLTLRDVLIVSLLIKSILRSELTTSRQTISCLLINPNPDSALNASAGTLLREEFDAFSHQAKLMTSIHAPIPPGLKNSVLEAKHRGEDPSSIHREEDTTTQRPRKQQCLHPGTIKNQVPDDTISDSENDDPASASKENNPSFSPTPVRLTPPSPRKTALGKRPLSVLAMPYPEDPDADMMLVDSDSEHDSLPKSSSEQNISANTRTRTASPQRKSPKLSLSKGNASFRRDDLQIYEDVPDRTLDLSRSGDGKENHTSTGMKDVLVQDKAANSFGQTQGLSVKPVTSSASRVSKKVAGGPRKVSLAKAKPRIGVRRL
jgi:ubiquitin-conjugating enzyme E2 S